MAFVALCVAGILSNLYECVPSSYAQIRWVERDTMEQQRCGFDEKSSISDCFGFSRLDWRLLHVPWYSFYSLTVPWPSPSTTWRTQTMIGQGQTCVAETRQEIRAVWLPNLASWPSWKTSLSLALSSLDYDSSKKTTVNIIFQLSKICQPLNGL